MKKIVCMVQPFTKQQKAYVYEDGAVLDTFTTTIPELGKKIAEYAATNNITTVSLTGSKQYNTGIQKDIIETGMNVYNRNDIAVTLH